jgi:hypothetical protein
VVVAAVTIVGGSFFQWIFNSGIFEFRSMAEDGMSQSTLFIHFWRHLLHLTPRRQYEYSEPIFFCGSGGPAFSILDWDKQLVKLKAGKSTMASCPLFAPGAARVDSFIDDAGPLK